MKNDLRLDYFGKEFDEIFNEEWYGIITLVINHVLSIPAVRNKYPNPDLLAKYILDYNINKQVESKILNKYKKDIPTRFDWTNKTVTECFLEFKKFIDFLDITSSRCEANVEIKADKFMVNEFEVWKEIVTNDYPQLEIDFEKTEESNTYRLVLKKDSNYE